MASLLTSMSMAAMMLLMIICTAAVAHPTGLEVSRRVAINVYGREGAPLIRVSENHIMPARRTLDIFRLARPLPKDIAELPFDHKSSGMLSLADVNDHARFLAVFRDGSGVEWGHVFLDPRLRYADGIHHEGKSSWFLHADADGDSEVLVVPPEVDRVAIYMKNTTSGITLSLTEHSSELKRRFAGQAGAGTVADPRVDTKNFVGPNSTQNSIVFISAGYTADQEGDFNQTVGFIAANLPSPKTNGGPEPSSMNMRSMHATSPFSRYWPMMNVFSVFQPSAQSGASRPKYGITVQNNLGCYHPAESERALACTWEKSVALADVSPALARADPDRALIIVVVNTHVYGGTGMSRVGKVHVANFFNGMEKNDDGTYSRDDDFYTSLVQHEIGHAYGDLVDEYDAGLGIESSNIDFPNCQRGDGPNPPSNVQWQHWISTFANPTSAANARAPVASAAGWNQQEASQWTVDAVPLQTCLFTNYYRPAAKCMMNTLRDYFMCPVCREGATLAVMRKPFEFQWPRWPLPDNILVLPTGSGATGISDSTIQASTGAFLHLPAFLTIGNGFSVSWELPDGTALPQDDSNGQCPCCVQLTPALLSNRQQFPINQVVNVTATIMDSTNGFISDGKAQDVDMLRQSVFFQIMVTTNTPAAAGAQLRGPVAPLKAHYGRANTDFFSSYQLCRSPSGNQPLCELQFSIKTFTAATDIGALLAKYDEWVLWGAVGLGLLLLFGWVIACGTCTQVERGVVRPIFETKFSGPVEIIRLIMKGTSVVLMVLSLSTLAVGAYYYTRLSTLGRLLVIAAVIVALSLYLMAFLGYWAVTQRNLRLLLANGIVLLLGWIIVVGLTAVAYHIGSSIRDDDSYWMEELESLWRSRVKKDPEQVCAVQGLLKCSGWSYPCDGRSNVVPTATCPTNCDQNNEQFGTSCEQATRDWIATHYDKFVISFGVCAAIMTLAVIFNIVYYIEVSRHKRAIRQRHAARLERLHNERSKGRQSGNQTEALLLLRSLDDNQIAMLVREFRRADPKHRGLTAPQLARLFERALFYQASKGELQTMYFIAGDSQLGAMPVENFILMVARDPDNIMQLLQSGGQEETVPLRMMSAVDDATRADILTRLGEVLHTNQPPNELKTRASASPPPPPPRAQQREIPSSDI